jgi:hypothetical protein
MTWEGGLCLLGRRKAPIVTSDIIASKFGLKGIEVKMIQTISELDWGTKAFLGVVFSIVVGVALTMLEDQVNRFRAHRRK